MFVIVNALENLSEEEKKRPVEERIALTMKRAGIAITVTSITDITAFGVGAITVRFTSKILIRVFTHSDITFKNDVRSPSAPIVSLNVSYCKLNRKGKMLAMY